jgi:hypothetical protein
MKKKRYVEKIRVGDPCSQDWHQMTGNEEVRFCTHCAKSVNNLSAMTRRDAMRLVRQSNGRICIRYIQHPETNAPVFADQLIQISRRVPRVAAGVMSASLSLSAFAYAQGGASRVRTEPAPSPQAETPAAVVTVKTTSDDDVRAEVEEPDEPTPFGSLSGKVYDGAEAVVPGAAVFLRDAEGTEVFRTTTDEEGGYTFERVPFAKYQLAASAPGFRERTLDVRIRESKERVMNLTLDIGAVTISGLIAVSRVEYQGALMSAVEEDDVEKARDLIASGEDVDRKEDDDSTPLFVAVERGNLEMVRLLLDFGANVNARNDEKQTPLMMIDEDASIELVELLLRKDARVNRVAENGDTALIRAAARNVQPPVLKALIDAGAELDVQNDEGLTALMNAADRENLETVRLLVMAGVDVNLRDKEGDNAWDHTAEEEIESFLVSHGIELDPEDLEGSPEEPEEPEEPA